MHPIVRIPLQQVHKAAPAELKKRAPDTVSGWRRPVWLPSGCIGGGVTNAMDLC